MKDPELRSLMKKVRMTVWDEYSRFGYNPPHAPYGCLVKIRLKDGRELSRQVDKGPWEPETPPQWNDLVEKFVGSAELLFSRNTIDQLIDRVQRLEQLEDITEIMRLVASRERS